MYVHDTLQMACATNDDRRYQLLWVYVCDMFVGALYHPLKLLRAPDSLLDHIRSVSS